MYGITNITNNSNWMVTSVGDNKKKDLKAEIIPQDGKGYVGVFVDNTDLTYPTYIRGAWYNNALNKVIYGFEHTVTRAKNFTKNLIETEDSFKSALNKFQERTGKQAKVILGFQQWFSEDTWEWQGFPSIFCDNVDGNGSTPMITWEPTNFFPGRDYDEYMLDEIVNAKEGDEIYEYIYQWALDAKDWGKPLMLRIMHEMNNGRSAYPWYGYSNGGEITDEFGNEKTADGPERYIAAWRRVHDIFEKAGADKVSFVWCPDVSSLPIDTKDDPKNNIKRWNNISDYYPGDNYVDWIGFDGYGRAYDDVFIDVYKDVIKFINDSKTDKPLAICEFSAVPNINKHIFTQELLVNAQKLNFKLVSLFNVNKQGTSGSEDNWSIFAPIAIKKDIKERYFSTFEVYKKLVTENNYFLGNTLKITLDLAKTGSEEVKDIIEEMETNEGLKSALEGITEYSDSINKIENFRSKQLNKIRLNLIIASVEEYEKLLHYNALLAYQYARTDYHNADTTEEKLETKKLKLFMGIINNLNGITQNSEFYLQALDKSKYVLNNWFKETEYGSHRAVKKEYLRNIPKDMEKINKYNKCLQEAQKLLQTVQNNMVNDKEFSINVQEIQNNIGKAQKNKISILKLQKSVEKAKKSLKGNDVNSAVLLKVQENIDKARQYLTYREKFIQYYNDIQVEVQVGGKPYISPSSKQPYMSAGFGLCDEIIARAKDDNYCKAVKFDEPGRFGLISSALGQKASILLDYYYHDYRQLNENQKTAILDTIDKMVNESRDYINKKNEALSWYSDLPVFGNNGTESSSDLEWQLKLISANVKAERNTPDSIKGARIIYKSLLNDKKTGVVRRSEVKKSYARLLKAEGYKSSASKAMGIFNELKDEDAVTNIQESFGTFKKHQK